MHLSFPPYLLRAPPISHNFKNQIVYNLRGHAPPPSTQTKIVGAHLLPLTFHRVVRVALLLTLTLFSTQEIRDPNYGNFVIRCKRTASLLQRPFG
jgi:hypothetical protein